MYHLPNVFQTFSLLAVPSLNSFLGTAKNQKMLQEWFEDHNNKSEVLTPSPWRSGEKGKGNNSQVVLTL